MLSTALEVQDDRLNSPKPMVGCYRQIHNLIYRYLLPVKLLLWPPIRWLYRIQGQASDSGFLELHIYTKWLSRP